MSDALKNWFYFLTGAVFLFLARVKHTIYGYSTPKPYSVEQLDRCIAYDIKVVDEWLERLYGYLPAAGRGGFLTGKRVLELGPGSDLGVGLYLLSMGIEEYNAVDVNDLVESASDEFYERFIAYLRDNFDGVDPSFLKRELARTRSGDNGRLNYVCRPDFDIVQALGSRKIDIIFSQAAFEHFDDIDKTIQDISRVAAKDAIAVVLIDLQTHSRWIKDKDPNNIYRYPKWFYDLFHFRGIPNRARPYQYKESFQKHGWRDIVIEPASVLSSDMRGFMNGHYSKEFGCDRNQMEYLSVWLCATKA